MKKKLILFLAIFSINNPCFAKEVSLNPDLAKKNHLRLSLDQAIKLAIKNRPSLKAFQYAVQASKQDEKKALSGYKPQINLTEKPSFQSGYKGIQNDVTIQADQLIYSFAGPLEEYKIAQKGTGISEYQKLRHQELIIFEVTRSFLQSWLLQRKNNFIKYLNSSSVQNIKKSEHENKLNLLDKNVWLNDAATYSENISTVYIYSDELKNARSELEYYIGKKFENGKSNLILTWDSKHEIKLEALNHYYNNAIKHRNDIKEKQKEIEQQEEYKNFYKKTYLPSLSLNGQAGRTSGNASNSIGAILNWSMFDGGTNYYESQKANANKLKALMEKDRLIQLTKFEIQKSYYELNSILKQLIAKNIRLTQAKNEIILRKQQFEIGDISKVDFEIAKYNWETQKFDWLTTKLSAELKLNELKYASGYYAKN
ncbi:hypothetical protein GF322_01135 [Candidatus Dependentiae bacterium]|nr:hypothetical protein [Candidatus Dependentiae bacterium]